MIKKMINRVLSITISIPLSYGVEIWAINKAYEFRGYEAIGGEYILTIFYFIISQHIFYQFLVALEETHECRKKGSGRPAVSRDSK